MPTELLILALEADGVRTVLVLMFILSDKPIHTLKRQHSQPRLSTPGMVCALFAENQIAHEKGFEVHVSLFALYESNI